jgi:hypothetical protein
MDWRQFAQHLLSHPETARAVMALVDAEATFEETSKHFPYSSDGGTVEDQETAERITALAHLLAGGPQPGDQPQRTPSGQDWGEIAELARRGCESITTEVWEPDPERPGRSKLVRTKTVREVYRELEAYLSEQHEGETWTSWMDGIEEGLGISFRVENADETPWPAAERIVAFSIRGGSEGDYVHVEALTEAGPRPLLLAKTFMGRESAWRAAKRIADLLGL